MLKKVLSLILSFLNSTEKDKKNIYIKFLIIHLIFI